MPRSQLRTLVASIAVIVTAGLLSSPNVALAVSADRDDDGMADGWAAERVATQGAGTDAGVVDVVDVVAVGDIACPPKAAPSAVTCRQQDTADLAQNLHPEVVFALGDLQYETGSLTAFQRSYDKSWGSLKPLTYPALGNHEYRTTGADGYYQYFAGQPDVAAPGYYAVQLGAWRVYVLNTNCTEVDCATERQWLRTALAERPAQCTLFTMHHPRFSSGEHGSQRVAQPFLRIGYRHGLDLALAGHDHHYERFARMDPDGQRDAARGFFQFVSGAGGKSHYDVDSTVAGSQFHNDKTFGVLSLKLRPGEFRYAFKTIKGQTPDVGARDCK